MSHFASHAVECSDGELLISNRTGRYVVVLDGTGLSTMLDASQVVTLARHGWASEIGIDREELLARERDHEVFQLLEGSLKCGETISIIELAKLLGVEDRLLDVSSLSGGQCTVPEDSAFTLQRGEYWVELRYSMYVPELHRSLLRNHAVELLGDMGVLSKNC